jgi:hypothetical protein
MRQEPIPVAYINLHFEKCPRAPFRVTNAAHRRHWNASDTRRLLSRFAFVPKSASFSSSPEMPKLDTSVFLIPGDFGGRRELSGVRNGEDRLVFLNDVAKSIVDAQRGEHAMWVFPYRGRAIAKINDSAWKRTRRGAAELWLDRSGQSCRGDRTTQNRRNDDFEKKDGVKKKPSKLLNSSGF